jgi:putative Mg2+ transporter-C (MgtC) family protein
VPTQGELVLHLLLAAALAGVLGIERELSEQPAGFRTHMLVGVGSALFSIISAFGFQAIAGTGPVEVVRADVTRVASQIVVGIGFLGGGAILKYGASVRGLTTAASLWVTAAVGTAAGMGMLVIATATTGIALLTLGFLKPLRAIIRRYTGEHVEFEVQADHEVRPESLVADLRRAGVAFSHVRVEEESDAGRHFILVARIPKGMSPAEAGSHLAENPRVHTVDWSR